MAQPKNHLSDLDRHMQQLEEKVKQLRSSLTHWQQWYLEYSALKEEVEHLPKDPQPRKDLARIRRDFDSELLTKKEINEIFGKNDLKDINQITSVLSRRIDYVEKNVTSLRKQLEAEEDRLSAASVIAHPDGGTDEESGLPITDIIEELDEDGNVVQSRLQSGADIEPRVVEALKKAGINDLPDTDADSDTHLAKDQSSAGLPKEEKVAATPSSSDVGDRPRLQQQVEPKKDTKSLPGRRKSVSFAEDTKPGHEAGDISTSRTAQRVAELMRKAKESETLDMSTAVIPDNESPEESALRREMLEYSMSEIGPVVAELQIEEGDSEDYNDDDDDWVATDDETEDEDELGRSKHSVITDNYVKRMQELEMRLKSQTAFAVSRSEPHAQDGGVGRVTVITEPKSLETNASGSVAVSQEPKSVRFATDLDIAEEKAPQPTPQPLVNPIGDIVERTAPLGEVEDDEAPPKRVSRFKKERAAAPVTPGSSLPPGPLQIRPKFLHQPPSQEVSEPAPPEGQTLAASVVERNVSSTSQEPDDMDDVLLYQAAAVEYNRLRNKMIQQQGGFLKEEETPTVPLDEEEGGPPRLSRFKAARLAKP